MFQLDPQLAADSFFLRDLPLCRVLLMNNALYPWLILVPRRHGMTELTDLTPEDRHILLDEVSFVSAGLQKSVHAYKMNIAALGNQVRQLHVHVIARQQGDATWPRPVWGGPTEPYLPEKAQDMLEHLRAAL